jgi:hypothetical protein
VVSSAHTPRRAGDRVKTDRCKSVNRRCHPQSARSLGAHAKLTWWGCLGLTLGDRHCRS